MLLLVKGRRSWSNFLFSFHLLSKGRPMTDYENTNKLLQLLDIKNYPILHWSNNIGWGMVTYMHEVVNKTQNLVQNVQFISFSCDEITTCDQQLWVSIHAYAVDGWQKILLLLSL
jgi:hypothetical protein